MASYENHEYARLVQGRRLSEPPFRGKARYWCRAFTCPQDGLVAETPQDGCGGPSPDCSAREYPILDLPLFYKYHQSAH
jgi:hypothetical protein